MSIRSLVREEITQELENFNNNVSCAHEVHPDINFDYNSLTLVVGQTGSGKTFNVNNDLAALKYVQHSFLKIFYITNNPNDLTLKKMKSIIDIPLEIISYSESKEKITDLREWIQAYDKVIDEGLEDKISPQCREEMLDYFGLEEFTDEPFYFIIIYDDAMNVFKKPSSPEFKYLFEYRHFRTTYILMLQSMKGLPTEIKAQLGGIWLFGNYNRQQFTYMANQINFPIDKEVVWKVYKQLTKHDYLYIHYSPESSEIYICTQDGKKRLLLEEQDCLL